MTSKKKTAQKPKAAPAKGRPPKPYDPHDVSAQEVANVLGLSVQQVNLLFRQRVIKQNGRRGRYDLHVAVPIYVQSIKTSGTAEAGERLKIAQRKKIEHQNKQAAGLIIEISEVAALVNSMAANFISAWRSIPRRIAGQLATLDDATACRELLEHEASNARLELSAPIRKFYTDRKETLPDILADTFDDKQAPPKKPRAVGKRKQSSAKGKRRTRPVAK